MLQIAIFWEKRFDSNKLFTFDDPQITPYIALKNILGENIISYDLLESKKNKDDYLILCLLTLSLSTVKEYISLFIKYPKNKKYFFIFEPKVVAFMNYIGRFHLLFDRAYTWNDSLVDNKKYFKFICPSSLHGLTNDQAIVPFSEKKLLTLINGNKQSFWRDELYSERRKFIRYAEEKNIEFDLYGNNRNKPLNVFQKMFSYRKYTSYKGSIGPRDKIKVLSGYKFNICFENMQNAPGLITEKIFDSFKAKSVPVYWGAPNIEHYIPKNCFIDYRNFDGDYNKLINFLSTMPESEYALYIYNIESFLSSSEAKKRFDTDWAKNFIKTL